MANLAEATWTSGAKVATTLTAAKAGLHPDLALEISILEDGVVRFLVDEVNPKKPRYKVQDVVIEDNLILVTRESSLGEVLGGFGGLFHFCSLLLVSWTVQDISYWPKEPRKDVNQQLKSSKLHFLNITGYGLTDGRTDGPIYRDGRTHLKITKRYFKLMLSNKIDYAPQRNP